MVNTAGLGIDDKHVLTSAMQSLEEVSPYLCQNLLVLAQGHANPGRLLAEIEETATGLRPRLVAATSPDFWFNQVDGEDYLDQVWEQTDKARRQVEMLDAVHRVCARLTTEALAGSAA